MNNLTKMKILRPASEVFEAFVDPSEIGKFWFSSSSERWESGKTIIVRYDEYAAKGTINISKVEPNRKIVFHWDYFGEAHVVTITFKELDDGSTIVEVNEEGFNKDNDELLDNIIGNKEGWVYMLTCLKGYLEFGVTKLRAALVQE